MEGVWFIIDMTPGSWRPPGEKYVHGRLQIHGVTVNGKQVTHGVLNKRQQALEVFSLMT